MYNKSAVNKLQKFLRGLPPEKFDFRLVIGKRECETVACACGWLPAIFPDKLMTQFDELNGCGGLIDTKRDSRVEYDEAAAMCLGIPQHIAEHLFNPGEQEKINEDLHNLNNKSSPCQVADMLDDYMKLCDDGFIEE